MVPWPESWVPRAAIEAETAVWALVEWQWLLDLQSWLIKSGSGSGSGSGGDEGAHWAVKALLHMERQQLWGLGHWLACSNCASYTQYKGAHGEAIEPDIGAWSRTEKLQSQPWSVSCCVPQWWKLLMSSVEQAAGIHTDEHYLLLYCESCGFSTAVRGAVEALLGKVFQGSLKRSPQVGCIDTSYMSDTDSAHIFS